MKLTPRLEAVYGIARESSHTIDIGTDHGKLAVALVTGGKASRVTASDINPLPLSRAERFIRDSGVSDRVSVMLADGAAPFSDAGADQIIIAGMGGELIREIISAAPWITEQRPLLILQPMTRAEKLREYLYGHGFEILSETAVCEGRRAYEIIESRYDGLKRSFSAADTEIGSFIRQPRTDSVTALLAKKRNVFRKRLRGACGDEKPMLEELITLIDKYTEV